MKIAYCLPALYISGGMERVLTIKANYFAEVLGYDIYIILTDGKEKKPFFPLSSKITVVNLDINFDEMYGNSFLKKALIYRKKQSKYKKKLKDLLCHLRPDITVSMLRREIVFLSSIPDGSFKIGELHTARFLVHDAFGSKMNWAKKLISIYWMKQLLNALNRLDKFVVLTHEDAKNWPEVNNRVVIPNPLPFFPNESSSCSSKQVIAVGRYFPIKGFDLLIDTWKIVSEKYPDWIIQIYGKGMKEPLMDQIEKLGLGISCLLKDPVPNIEDKFIQSSIFVLSSRSEGFGMVVAEAMACGIPAISFACPCGPSEIIEDGIDGLLVERENIQSLAAKICYLIENDQLRKQMGQAARKNIKRLMIENIANQWKELFESFVGVVPNEKKGKISVPVVDIPDSLRPGI